MFKLVEDINEANCITHGAKFHADDVFSTVIMAKVIPNMKLIRVIEVPKGQEEKIVYDIGAGEFDHHQKGGNGQRENGIKYAAFGLLWKKFGKEYLKKISVKKEYIDLTWEYLDTEFVQFVDSIDNGQFEYEKIGIPIVTVSEIIGSYNPKWNEELNYDKGFLKAFNIAEKIWDNKVKDVVTKIEAKNFVEQAIENSNEEFIVLEKHMPYQDFVINSKNPKAKKILYAIYPSNRGGFAIQAIQKNVQSFENRKPFPESWAGLRDKNLQEVTRIKTAKFCHNARFLCTTEKLEDAIKLAKKAIKFDILK